MTFVTRDRILVFSFTSGTGAFTLEPAANGYQNFDQIGNGNQTYYTITNATDWEVGIGTYNTSGPTLSRDQVLASSNGGALVNWVFGRKRVYVPQPALATQGSAATGDNSAIGTNQIAWENFRKNVNASVQSGVTFRNNGIRGIASTYGLLSTGPDGAYVGGVLNANKDIHFVPNRPTSQVGQKVNILSGVVSTYSLIYTTINAYVGGALDGKGDIHFVPFNANRGQKVSQSGVVSTYSLIYTTVSAYQGGVLNPSGDIHFVPSGAIVGQKVSAAGVVSTYSLVYTAGNYFGGVLAPNGDIHFVPSSSAVGQKISAAGVVSTYSLIYTAGSYQGGVLDSNGNIHFVPASAAVGQKISPSGVVSTYSLAYTTTNAYSGGVLAPSGDVHFVVSSAAVGQKISDTGVVTTYSLAYTNGDQAYSGGVVAQSGEIYFVPFKADRGQKIFVNPAIPFSVDTCISSYLNKF